jgi:biopolymer transport protein TolR
MKRVEVRPDMNVTPLVDVVLVLLIIFMVIMPQMEAGAAVDTPSVTNPDAAEKNKLEKITVSLTPSGTMWVEKEILEHDAALVRLAELRRANPSHRVVLKADKRVKYQEVRRVVAAIRELGFPGIALQVGDKKKKGE